MVWTVAALCDFRFWRRRPSSKTTLGQFRGKVSRNIVILGSLGIGKSSLVNMLVGRPVAPVSSNIGVAHPPIVEYPILLKEISGDTSFPSQTSDPDPILRIFDTLGLEHRPSPWNAIKQCLQRSGGAHLVMYCMRRGRLSAEQTMHLDTIWKTFCREGGVPLVLVVGDIGYLNGSPEQWWEANGEHLKKVLPVEFDDHICLNTWDPSHPSWEHQGSESKYEETQKLARGLVIRYCKTECGRFV